MNDSLLFEPERPPFGRFDFLLLFLAVLVGFAVRYYIAREAFATTFDCSTVGLMAMRILEGDRPWFFYGQTHMGALEAYTAALIFGVFGISTLALAMAPILYALGWIVAVYVLFREIYDGERWVAFAAALTAAVGSVPVLWYTLASYGGYPEYLLFGTLFLWLALRLAVRSLSAGAIWGYALAMGICGALAIWTNLQSTVFIATGTIILVWRLVTQKCWATHLVPLVASMLLGLCGLIPSAIEAARVTSQASVEALLEPSHVPAGWHSFVQLIQVHLRPDGASDLLQAVILGLLLIASLYYLASLCMVKTREDAIRRLTPLLLACVFLALYLPHPMAQRNAPHYLLPAFTVGYAAILAAGFSLPIRALRVAALIPLVFMTVVQVRAALTYVNEEAPRKAALVREMNATSTAVQRLGVKHIYMVGNELDGHMGQMYTFFARDKAKFVSLFSNRAKTDEISAECDQRPGFLVYRRHTERINKALHNAGVRDYKTEALGRTLYYDMRVRHREERSMRPADVFIDVDGGITGNAEFLFDRNADTGLQFTPNEGTQATVVVTIDIGKPRTVGGFDIEDYSDAGSIRAFAIEVSENGVDYIKVRPPEELLSVYTCGNKVYMLGYNGHWQFRFDPIRGRFLRVTMGLKKNAREDWFVHEMYILNMIDSVPEVHQSEVKAIRARADDLRLESIAADRWLTYQLSFRSHGFTLDGMIPYPNYRYRSSQSDHKVACHPNNGFVVARAFAEEAQNVLRRTNPPGLKLRRTDFDHYVMFHWDGQLPNPDAAPLVQWSGLMPLNGTEVWW